MAVWFNTSNFPKTEVGSGKSGAPVQTLENLEMKKTLVALAALASVSAFAQSSVGIKGTFDPSLVNQVTTYASGAVRATTALGNNTQGTSQVTFFGTEEIGGGLKANFLIENDFDATKQATNNFSSKGGEVFVGLSGSYGAIQLGAPNTPSLDVSGRTPFGTKIGSGFSSTMGYGVQGLGHVREDNSVVVTSPTYAGLTLKAGVAGKSVTGSGDNTNAAVTAAASKEDIGATYVNGPLKAVLANYKQEGVYKQTHGYVAYTVGALTATYGFNSDERLAAQTGAAYTAASGATPLKAGKPSLAAGKLSGSNIAVSYAMGATTLMANWGKLNDKTSDNMDQKMTAFGIKQDLSKRTSVYARYAKQTVENTPTSGSGYDLLYKEQKTVAVGMMHNF
mgnify:CR=1 FL=1|jgi:predicted porin